MKYLKHAILGLFSLGFLGLIVGIFAVAYIVDYYGKDLPDYAALKEYKPPIITRIYAGDGRLMAEFAQERRVFVPIDEIPALVKHAFIAAEDKNFYKHEGIDFLAIARAMRTNLINIGKGRRQIGASTITQQVVKNFLLTNEATYERKIKEAILAYRMERAMSKDRILELYLNEIFLGSRAYGIAAASQQYFNKALDELTLPEAAYLAALPKAPNNYHPVRHHEAAIKRRNEVIDRMLEDKYVTQAEADLAKVAPLVTVPRDESRIVNAPYFAEEVRRELGTKYGQDSLYQEGMVVRTTINPRLQDIAVRALRDGLQDYDKRHGYRGPLGNISVGVEWENELASFARPEAMLETWDIALVLETGSAEAKLGFSGGNTGSLKLENVKWAKKCLNECYAQGPEPAAVSDVVKKGDVILVEETPEDAKSYILRQVPLIQGAVIAMDPHTGRILAMQGGWTYGTSEYNRATQAKRQPGSSFKPFVYLAALDKGFTPATLVLDAPFVIEDRPGHYWSPQNYSDDFLGPTTLRQGIEKSRNLMTVRLADHIGMETIAEYAKRFGIMDDMQPRLSYALGAGETTLLKMASAYAVLVNGGKKIDPSIIDRIQDRRGATIFQHDARPCIGCGQLIRWDGQGVPDVPDNREQIADPRTAYQMVSILEGVALRGTAVKLKSLNRPLGGKTGTTNESKDTWFVGFSPDLVVGVFMGFDDPRSLGKRETGSSVALPVFKQFMEEALKDVPAMPFRTPPGIKNIRINAETGVRAQPGDSKVIWEAFVQGTEPTAESVMLDDSGVNLMPSSGDPMQNPGTYNPAPGETPYVPQETMPAPTNTETNTGTGGLY
jgi:penicillin-binding protein 1A